MYKTIRMFTDLQDDNHRYQAGDIFPRKGLRVSDKRLLELSGSENRRGIPLIEKVEDPIEPPKTKEVEKTIEPVEETIESTEEQVEETKLESKPKRSRKNKEK